MRRNPVVTFKRRKDDTGSRVVDVVIDGVVVDTVFRDPDTTNWYSLFRPSSNHNWELATTGSLDDLKYSIEHGSDMRYTGGRRYGTRNNPKRNAICVTLRKGRQTKRVIMRHNPLDEGSSPEVIGKNIRYLMHHQKELTATTPRQRWKQAIAIAFSKAGKTRRNPRRKSRR